jgi:acyl carrier protein
MNNVENKNTGLQADIEKRVKQIIVDKLGVKESSLTPESNFIKDMGADSLDTVELVMGLEKEFNLPAIPDDKVESISTVGDAIKYISENYKP